MSKTTMYCNNCSKSGHSYNNCRSPITSVGIIAFRPGHSGIEFLMIRRRDSFGFVDFVRGKYPVNNEEYIQRIVDEMTLDEKRKLRTNTFEELWRGLWGEYSGSQYRSEEGISHEKYRALKSGVKSSAKEEYRLENFLDKSTTSWTETEWGFPKGRRNYHEKDVVCALRECLEETGYDIHCNTVIQNLAPYEEVFMGSDMKCYKQKYYLAYLDAQHTQTKTHDRMEVSQMKWMTYDECMSSIRPYNLEKKAILTKVNKVLQEYKLQ